MPQRVIQRRRGTLLIAAGTIVTIAVGAGAGIVGYGDTSPDTSPPHVFLTGTVAANPQPATISGTVTIAATCADNVGVAGVQFQKGGVNLGAEDTNAAGGWTVSWNTTLVPDGPYTLSAVCRDAAGNTAVAATKSVVTSNAVGGGGTDTAVLWVAPNSSGVPTCKRSTIGAVDYATAVTNGNVCDKPPTAYSKAQLGDTVLIKGGTFTSQWYFTAAMRKTGGPNTCDWGTQDFSQCVTFLPATGETVTLHVASPTVTGQIFMCATYVRMQNIVTQEADFTNGGGFQQASAPVQVGKGDNTCGSGSSVPHDLIFQNFTYQGAGGIVGGSYNTWFVGGTADYGKESSWQLGGQRSLAGVTTGPAVTTSGYDGITFHGVTFTKAPTSAVHQECIHLDFTGDNNILRNNIFEACPVFAVRIEAEAGGWQRGMLVENNVFDTKGLNFDCNIVVNNPAPPADTCQVTGNTVRFNTFMNGAVFGPTDDCALHTGVTCTVNTNVDYGNIAPGCASNVASGALGWSPSYNVYSGGQTAGTICVGDSTSLYSQTINLVSPGSPSYDGHLSSGSNPQAADNFVPTSVTGGCPATDLDGTARPIGANCDAGADER